MVRPFGLLRKFRFFYSVLPAPYAVRSRAMASVDFVVLRC